MFCYNEYGLPISALLPKSNLRILILEAVYDSETDPIFLSSAVLFFIRRLNFQKRKDSFLKS
ncbi:hypothetical protein [Leptospira biflexa]|nr:hypothetical protein [Leptospira biflexa]TGM44447.1 hypothetical protein EHQ88_17725 [Leptospira biflexa]